MYAGYHLRRPFKPTQTLIVGNTLPHRGESPTAWHVDPRICDNAPPSESHARRQSLQIKYLRSRHAGLLCEVLHEDTPELAPLRLGQFLKDEAGETQLHRRNCLPRWRRWGVIVWTSESRT